MIVVAIGIVRVIMVMVVIGIVAMCVIMVMIVVVVMFVWLACQAGGTIVVDDK